MAVYILVYGLVVLMWFFTKRIREKKVWIGTMFAALFLISTLRHANIGADYKNYISIFGAYGNIGIWGNRIYGTAYRILNGLALQLGNSYVYLALVVNILIFGTVFYVYQLKIKKEYLAFAVALWVCNPYAFIQSSFNMLRQGCAMAVVLLASCFLSKEDHKLISKRNINFVIMILVAGSFHKSAYVFLFLLLFGMISWKREYHLILVIFCAILNLITNNSGFMLWLAKIIGYQNYVETWGSAKFDIPVFIIFITLFVFYLITRYPGLFTNKEEKWYVDLYLVSLSLLLLLVKNDQAYRLYIYFFYITLISVTTIIKNISYGKENGIEAFILKNGYFFFYSAMYWAFLLLQMVQRNVGYYPFRFFWQI